LLSSAHTLDPPAAIMRGVVLSPLMLAKFVGQAVMIPHGIAEAGTAARPARPIAAAKMRLADFI